MMPLAGELIVDLSTGRAGGYCGKLLVDAGADVVKVEPPAGDPLRRHAGGKPDVDSALFRHLAGSKLSVVTDIRSADDTANLIALLGVADGVIWSPGSEIAAEPRFSPASIRAVAGEATVVSLSPFGLEGPWAGRPANEATLQAMCGGASQRGTLATPPLIVGGGLGDFETGLVGAVAYLLARARRVRDGGGELVDVSALEAECLTMVMYGATYASMAGVPMRSVRMTNLPGIHASRDGYVGFMVVTGQQWLDFAAMVERPDWVDDESLLKFQARGLRKAELLGTIDRWMGERTSEEIADLANAFRIPVAILGNGATVPEADHFVDQHWFEPHPGGDFVQPTVPYRFGGSATSRPLGTAPMLGEHTGSVQELIARRQSVAASVTESSTTTGARPLAGIRIIDFCNNWAGPIIAHVCGMFGADVIKVESAARPDPLRFNSIKPMSEDRFWEWSPLQHGPNTSKRGITLDMSSPRGRELALALIADADVVVENYSPRVMDNWGLTAGAVRAANPDAIFVRAPAYGLDGPWRDRVGYAQTIEMTAGLAWVTGTLETSPEIPNGPCDPIAGLHATFALLLALEHRRRSGEGMLLETPMVGGALGVAVEQVVEFSASGRLLERDGNRSTTAAPQGAYVCNDDDLPFDQGRWVMISVETDEQWCSLVGVLGAPAWASDSALLSVDHRRAQHDALDAGLSQWCSTRAADDIVDALLAVGVPAAKVLLANEQLGLEQLHARGWFSTLHHPVVGDVVHGGFPAVFSVGPTPAELHTAPPPLLGQHNREVLGGLLRLSDSDLATLEDDGVIGTRVRGGSAW